MDPILQQQQQDADAQLELWEEEGNRRHAIAQQEMEGFMEVLRQRVRYEASADLIRIYAYLKADPLRGNRVTCSMLKVPRPIPFSKLAALLHRRFGQELLFTFQQPSGNGHEERLLTPFNIDVLWEVGHLLPPVGAPKPCHVPTYFLKARLGKLNPTLPSPFLPPAIKGAPVPPTKSPPRSLSPIHRQLFEAAAEARQKREAQRQAADEAVQQQAIVGRALKPRAEAEMVHRMYAASLQEMAEAAARQRQEEEAELRQRLLVISPAGAADQIRRFYEDGIKEKEKSAKELEKKWAPPPRKKGLSEAEIQAMTGRLYSNVAEHKEALRRQLYDEVYKPKEGRSGPRMSPAELENTFQRLYKS